MDLAQAWMNLWNKSRTKLVYFPLEAGNVDFTADYQPLEYGRHYIRLWLAEMYLKAQVRYFQTWYPAVHSILKFDFNGQQVEVPNVADASKVGMRQIERGDVVAVNFVLTPLIPFNSGVIDLDAGLMAVEGENYLNSFISTLSDFAGLLAVPQFSAALNVAGPLAKGLQALIGAGDLQLALHDTFGDQRVGGYFAVIRASQNQVNPAQLRVEKHQLRIANSLNPSLSQPFEEFDHMLFRLEVTEKRPDYDSLASIQTPMRQAHQALKDMDETKAETFLRAAIIAAHEAPELTRADRTRVKLKLKEDFNKLKEDLGFSGLVGGEEYSLDESMKHAMPVQMAVRREDPTFDELFGD